ncbi:hypothetical protein M2175_004614 [Bradyrhizobium elkanii]|uniref:hypothetical protein n=1 Tax=Bradyrhizobium TaxID=374 RepID=UPI0021671D7D|nr:MULTISPECIES: hypothetical protein [Bradyrhizobium]MCS3929583.1 hypothetical protein [Bradyrhizobium elkanii]MCS3970140.1 hypothetical protein [Bradyrhizobium japonicum]
MTKPQLANEEIARNVIALRDELARATLGRDPSDPEVKMALLLNDCIYGTPGDSPATPEHSQGSAITPRWQRILDLEAQARGLQPPPMPTPEQRRREDRNAKNLEVIATKAKIDLYAPGIGFLFFILLVWWIFHR